MFRSVLVVCVGNICRSPIGERFLVASLPGFKVASAGLHALAGQGADPAAAAAAADHGINLDGHVARRMTSALGAQFDLILVMEKIHRDEVAQRMPQLLGRTMLFGHWMGASGADIPDPYRSGPEMHQKTALMIHTASLAWIARLKAKET